MKIKSFVALTVLAMAVAGCVRTAPKQTTFWNKCDGFAAPEGIGKLAGRGILTAATLGIVWAAPEDDKPWARVKGLGGVSACDEALENDALDAFPVRKLNILRARAIHNLEAKQFDAAAHDLQAMRAIVPELKGDPRDVFNATSAVQVVEGAYLIAAGNVVEGEGVIRTLAQERPYSQTLLSNLVGLMPKGWQRRPENVGLIDMLSRFSDDLVLVRALASLREIDVDADTVEDWKFVIISRFSITGTMKSSVSEAGKLTVADPSLYLSGAMTVARAGEIALAREWLHTLSDIVADMGDGSLKHEARKYSTRRLAPHQLISLKKMLPQYEVAIESYENFHAGRYALARKPFEEGMEIPVNRLTLPLVKMLQETVPEAERKGILQSDVKQMETLLGAFGRGGKMGRTSVSELFSVLPVWRPYEQSNSYSSAITFLKSDGFKDKKLADNEWKIAYTGSASSRIAVEEMSMLRAAQIAKKNGASHFVIGEQKNYSRTVTTTMNGSPVGPSKAAGYKTELFIKLYSPEAYAAMAKANQRRAFRAEEVFDELYKVYAPAGKSKKKRSSVLG